MEHKPYHLMSDQELDAEIDVALDRAQNTPPRPYIVEASYHPEAGMEFLKLKLNDGRRLRVPREELSELKDATDEQATDLLILPNGNAVWWPQLDDGLYLPDFLEHRWRKAPQEIAA